MLKIKKANLVLVSVAAVVSSLLTAKCIQSIKDIKDPEAINIKLEESPEDARRQDVEKNFTKGAWISFMDLDVHQHDNTEEAFKKNYDSYVDKAKKHNLDYLVVHVRSHSDALYPSKIFPWSHTLTGTQGTPQNFDPLKYAIDQAHKSGLKFHAWVNPLRISSISTPKQICETNPYSSKPYKSKVIDYKTGKIANPAYPEVRKLIVDGIKEIVENYDVDAIHLDDYFYPEVEDISQMDFAYQEYMSECTDKSPMSAEQWRIHNINLLIKEISETIKSLKSHVEFGISPPGVLEKCQKIGADIPEWISKGYVDYICPQIYWSLDFKAMPFEDTLKRWEEVIGENRVKMYVGLAVYKAGSREADAKTWSMKDDILATEYDIVKRHSLDGVTLFSLKYMDEPQCANEIFNLDKKLKNRCE